jgi:hypothetical protein
LIVKAGGSHIYHWAINNEQLIGMNREESYRVLSRLACLLYEMPDEIQ